MGERVFTGGERLERVARQIVKRGAITVRDVDRGEEPLLYSSGFKGPVYANIKGLVSTPLIRVMSTLLVEKLASENVRPDFVAANVTGGLVPGVFVASTYNTLGVRQERMPMVYVRGARKKGGLREHVTGLDHLPEAKTALVIEELVNFANTTVNSAVLLRDLGYEADHAACLVTYGHGPAVRTLEQHEVQLHSLLEMRQLLAVCADEGMPQRLVKVAYDFIEDPEKWMADRGLVRDEEGGT